MSSTNASVGFADAELFRGLAPDELVRLERGAHTRHDDTGAIVVREGRGGIAYFVVTSGKVAITRAGSDGQQRELRAIGPGGSFAEMALFSERPRAGTVTAVEPTDCLALHRLELLEDLRRNPEVALDEASELP